MSEPPPGGWSADRTCHTPPEHLLGVPFGQQCHIARYRIAEGHPEWRGCIRPQGHRGIHRDINGHRWRDEHSPQEDVRFFLGLAITVLVAGIGCIVGGMIWMLIHG